MSASDPERRLRWALAALLVVACGLAYAPVAGFGFVAYDDPPYVSANPMVARGLTLEGVRWAFGSFHASNWHPLTWLSHMLDVELFGLDAGKHHLVSLGLHALNACLCLFALSRLGLALAPAFLVAALFAAHPLRVESVAWIAERKDVLSGTFFFATLFFYAGWARGARPSQRRLAYGCFALGLLAKSMLVTVPLILLLLDRWPLKRIDARGWRPLVVEKLPFFVLSLAAGVATLVAQQQGGAIQPFERLSLSVRLAHAPLALFGYLRRFLWPSELASYYPHPALAAGWDGTAWGAANVAALAATLALTLLALRWRERGPALLVGWLWTLVMLLPVIGIVQVGGQALADRYAYLPLVGLSLVLAVPLWRALGERATLLAGLASLVVFVPLARHQVLFWSDSITLFRRADRVGAENFVSATNLGAALAEAGRLDEARPILERAVRLAPRDPRPRTSLGTLFVVQGAPERAREAFEGALAVAPDFLPALRAAGRLAAEEGDAARARKAFERVLTLAPDDAEAHFELALVAEGEGRRADALEHYRAAHRQGGAPQPALSFAWLVATTPSSPEERAEALALARRAAAAAPSADALDVLAAAQAAGGDFAAARETQRRAIAAGGPEGLEARRAWLARYEAGLSLVLPQSGGESGRESEGDAANGGGSSR